MKSRKLKEIFTSGVKNSWPPDNDNGGNSSVAARNLSKASLGGVIFGCKHSTISECLENQLFGLPGPHISYIRKIEPGLPLFLFNYSDRKLHGIFEAASPGQMNIDPYGWTENGKDRTPYPAQARFFTKTCCQPLDESVFRPVISDNYYTHHHFYFELDRTQTNVLMSLFKPVESKIDSRSSHFTSKDESIGWVPLPSSSKGTREINEKVVNGDEKGKSRVEFYCQSSSSSSSTEEREGKELDCYLEEVACDTKTEYISSQSGFCFGEQDRKCSPEDFPVIGHGPKRMDNIIMKLKNLAKSSKTAATPEVLANDIKQIPDGSSSSSHDNPKIVEPVPDSSVLVKMIEELRERVILLEKKQAESEREVQELRNAARETCHAAQGLREYTRELESKLHVLSASKSAPTRDLLDQSRINFSLVPGELVYVIGGFDGNSWLSTLDSYSHSLDLLTSLSPMSVARSYASAAALAGCLYVFGGGDGSLWYDTVECYERERDEWLYFPPLVRAKGNLAGATLNGKIFAIGGGNGFESFSDVEMIDPILGKWINHQPMLQKRFALAAAELGGALYSVGGFDGEGYLRSGERFDPREGLWTRIPSMNTARGCHSMAVLNDKLYVVGGYAGSGLSAGVEVYDPRASSWYAVEEMNVARGYAAAVVVGGSLYAIGGVTFRNDVLDSVESYSEGIGWTVTNLSAVGKRAFFSAIVL